MAVHFTKKSISLPAESCGVDNVIAFPTYTEQTNEKAHEHSFQFSLVANHSDASPKPCEESWQKFVARLDHPEVRGPLSLEAYLTANSDDQDAQKNGAGFVPAVFDGKGRADKNVTVVTGIGLDFDNKSGPPVNRAYIEAHLNGLTYAAHTTYSHSKEHQRWRVIVPFLKSVLPGKLPAVYEHFKQLLPDVLDAACMNPSRLFYLPACPPGGESIYDWFASNGTLFDPLKLPDVTCPTTEAAPTPLGEKISKGKRNATLASIAGSLRRQGLYENAIRNALWAINQSTCEPPLPEAEVDKIARASRNTR